MSECDRVLCGRGGASVRGAGGEMEVTETKAEEAQVIHLEDGVTLDSRDLWDPELLPGLHGHTSG